MALKLNSFNIKFFFKILQRIKLKIIWQFFLNIKEMENREVENYRCFTIYIHIE